MKQFIPPTPILCVLLVWTLVGLSLTGCANKSLEVQKEVKAAQFQMPAKPASCTQRTAFPLIVRQCRMKVCSTLKGDHCKNGLDDVAAAQWISCTKEELLVSGANGDDCRLFVYDLEAAMKAGS